MRTVEVSRTSHVARIVRAHAARIKRIATHARVAVFESSELESAVRTRVEAALNTLGAARRAAAASDGVFATRLAGATNALPAGNVLEPATRGLYLCGCTAASALRGATWPCLNFVAAGLR